MAVPVIAKGNARKQSSTIRLVVLALSIIGIVALISEDPTTLRNVVFGGTTSTATTSSVEGGAISKSTKSYSESNVQERIKYFRDTALSFDPVSDKVGVTSEHRYHNMYGTFLLPYVANKPNLKFLEIGLGCNMDYGPGASVKIWKKLLPMAELWEAEFVKDCVEKAQEKGQLEGINTLVGDQADFTVLDGWIEKSGGHFDVVIDDGGHHNCMISNSFDKLWPQVLPGGLYFIEDLHVGRASKYQSESCGNVIMSDKIHDWNQHLIYLTNSSGNQYKYGLPEDLLFIHCQAEACVLGKRASDVNDPYNAKKRGQR